jgi:tetratricopeptide (TPR) repeat protein
MKKVLIFVSMMSSSLLYATGDTPNTSVDNFHAYIWANYKGFGAQYADAQQWYNKLLQANPPAHVYKGYINFLADTGQVTTLISLIPKLDQLFAQDADIQLIFALALQKGGNKQEADERYLRLSSQFKTHQSIVFQAANIYIARKEPENALTLIDGLLNNTPKKPNNFVFLFLKAQLYTQLQQPDKALDAVKACLAMQPHFDKGWLLYALLEEQAGRLTEAVKGYTSYLEIAGGSSPDIERHLLQLAFKQKNVLTSTATPPITNNGFAKALQLFESKEYTNALKTVDEHLARKPDDTEGRLLKIQILTALKQYGPATQQLKQWILKEPTNVVWFNTLHLLCRKGLQYQKAINTLEEVLNQQPTNTLALLNLADFNTRARNYERALSYHRQALKESADAQMKTKILFTMALIYHEKNDDDAMEKVLEEGLALGKDFPPLLNLLAYHYATQNKKLTQAQKLIALALQKNKNNPHFLDTQATILYAQKEYAKALEILESIKPQLPHDPAMLRTLSKTHYQLGNKKEAIATMEQALTLAQRDHDKKICTSFLCQWGAR